MHLTTIALAALSCSFTLASITLEDLPSKLRAGSSYYIKWTQDRDYHLSHFNLMHEENSGGWYEPVQIVDHMINYTAGSHEMWWEVPVVKADSGFYKLQIHGIATSAPDYHDGHDWLPEIGYDARSNRFEIVGGPTLYKKEIAGVVGGTLVVMVLLIGAVVLGSRIWRRREAGVAL